MPNELSHVDSRGKPGMVDVSAKQVTLRKAIARSIVWLGPDIIGLLEDGEINTKKGPVFQTAIIAGTAGVKNTSQLIPFCHPIGLDSCKIEINNREDEVIITCEVTVEAKTGVEMEALTGASVAALTVYDMCKAVSSDIIIRETRLLEKTGGKRNFSIDE